MTTSSLRQRVVRSAAWTVPTSVGSRAVGLLGTLLLARYLAPTEYGVVMAAAIAATTASSATTFGVGIYLVANAKISRAEAFHASCWFLATGVAAVIGTMMLGGPLGRWSGAPGLAEFLPVLMLSTLLERIVYVPERLLVRNLRFGWLSVARAGGELTYTAVSVICAAQGGGAMAIAWGCLARSAVRFVAIVPAVGIREWLEPHRLQLATFLRIVGYGLNVSVASIVTFGMRRWDNLLISRYFGAASMGAYNYAYNLADTPATAIGDQLGDIVAASFPHVDQRRRAAALVHSCTMVSMIMFPLSIGLAAVAPTVVDTFFDSRWSNVGAMLMSLSALSIARPLGSILASYFYASRRPSVVLWLECASLMALVAAISTLGRVGINWACGCVGMVFVLRTLAGMWMVRRLDGVLISEFLLPMMRPLAACIAMAAGVSVARLALAGLTPPIQLLVEIAVGATIYIGAALLVARSQCGELLSAVRSARSHGSSNLPEASPETAAVPRVLSLSTEFPNPSEPGKGLFVRSRLEAIRSRTSLLVVAPIASLDYANPQRNLFAALRIPRARKEGHMHVLHPRWLYPPYGGWTNAFFLFARLLPVLARLRARCPFDVIDAHFAHPEGIAAVLLGRILGRPVLVTLRGSEFRYYRQRSKNFWMSWALRRTDRVIAVSDGLRELAIDLGVDPRRVKTVPNGINADVFFRRDRLGCRSNHGIAPAERIILSAGDLAELKGHHRVIAAVKNLTDRGVRARLLIAGGVGRSGRYAGTLRQLVTANGLGDRVAFLGEVTQETLAELMSAADVFCLASSTEGWPNVVNEALACGTPVVATDVGAVRQMVVSDSCGSVVPVHDGGALTEALRAALTAQWDHEAISAWGRSRSWSLVAEEVLEEMRAVMAERSRKH
ncbi:MAG TPA: oligosaccharide flippase family protein, partial [Vicinamibacterales bacterium]|nr:oligosaccharide flippase family protein [Vicinamibacterales bacterium]